MSLNPNEGGKRREDKIAQNKIVENNPTISITTININGLNTLVKRMDFLKSTVDERHI